MATAPRRVQDRFIYEVHRDPVQESGLLPAPAVSGVVRPAPERRAAARVRHLRLLPTSVVLVVALVARLGVILREGGVHGIIGYDCGVYFSGADALLHGRLPYRDFTMVHPPGITLAVTPFAALTRVMSDWHAFIVADIAFCLIGAVDAVLVVVVCDRLGMARRGAVAAGLFYAVWFGSISAEFDIKLEPLSNLLFLLGLLALLRDRRLPTRWSAVAAGAVIGLPVAVKIWWVVPVLLLIGWHGIVRRSRRAALQALLGAVASVSVICAPFFLADPSGMWQSVVTGQLGRPRHLPVVDRLAVMSTVPALLPKLAVSERALPATVFAVVLAAVLAFAWYGARRSRVFVVVLLVQLGVLLAAPSWFEYYCDYLAVALAICVGGATVAIRKEMLTVSPAAVLTAGMAAITCVVTVAGTQAIRPYAGAAALTRAVRHEQCVTSNNPTELLRLDALTRGLAAGCPDWIDVTGRDMGPDRPAILKAAHLTWDGALVDYLRSGDAIAFWRPDGTAYLQGVADELAKGKVIARVGSHVIYVGGPHP